MNRLATLLLSVAAACALSAPVAAQDRKVRLVPYIEAAQVLTAQIGNGGDVLTYTQLSTGIDATVTSRRVTATIAARYDHNFGYSKKVADIDVVTGLARVSAAVTKGLSIDGGAVATRSRSDMRGPAPGLTAGNLANTSQVISADVGPTVTGHVGPVAVGASYRFGGTEVSTPSDKGLPAGARALGNYSSSQRHSVTATAGVRPGQVLPVGLTASGAYEREDVNTLKQKYEGYYGRGDVLVPVAPTLALIGGAGYEKIEISQRDPVVDGSGNPVVDAKGRYVIDSTNPRRIAFDTRGLFWDAGVLYRPSQRTTMQARVGRRYDSMTYTGSLAWQAGPWVGLNVGVYDGIQSFGRQLRGGVASIPTTFATGGDPLGQNFTGCVFGQSNAEAGGCLNSAFQSINTAQYRARGVDAVLVARRGRTQLGLGLGYANRKFLVPDAGPDLVVVNGTRDQSYYVQAFAGRQLSASSGIDINGFADVFDSGIPGSSTVYSAGASTGYYHRFGNLGATATVGIYGYDSSAIEAQVEAQARLGLRYGF